uniref:Uncharacterized protein n=1 Tax=Glossina palpalis gambiensis TaxID=67801 RepID=A0A1B0B8L5_9MUSC
MSTKASSQPGRRTPLSLSGAVTKTPSNSKNANSNNTGSNGHPANANAKTDDKNQQKTEQLISNNKMDVKDQTTQPSANKRLDKSQNAKDKNEKKLKDDKATEEAKAELEVVPPKHENKGSEKKKDPVVEEKSVPNDNAAEQKTFDKKEEKMEIEESIKSTMVSIPKSKEDHKVATPTTKSVKTAASTKAGVEKTPQKSGTVNNMEKPTTIVLVASDEEGTSSADVSDMEPLVMDVSPNKLQPEHLKTKSLSPSATSTPGKALSSKRNKANVVSETAQRSTQFSSLPERPRPFSQISGRRSIRPITDYTPSKFQGNLHYRESYRRIDSELDTTSSSLNVTVGSEPANNSSFFFFGRGRKRERTPPPTKLQSTDGLSEIEVSPPKKARMDFLSVVYSPITMLRNRFSRASLQSSTPVNLHQKFNTEIEVQNDEIEVQNVSGEITTQEDLPIPISSNKNDITDTQGDNVDVTLGLEIESGVSTSDTVTEDIDKETCRNTQKTCCLDTEESDIQFKETPLPIGDGIAVTKNKRCAIM